MFTAWLKRSSLKQQTGKRGLITSASSGPNFILLISLAAVFVVLGIFVTTQAWASGTVFNSR